MILGHLRRGPRRTAVGLLLVGAIAFSLAAITVERSASLRATTVDDVTTTAPSSSPDAPAPDDVAAAAEPSADQAATGDEQRAAALPVSVRVPSVGIDARIEPVGVDHERRLIVPPPQLAGWFEGRAVPGEIGPAVLVGHVDSLEGPAVFHGLDRVRSGDLIHVTDAQGGRTVFAAERVQVIAKSAFPTSDVYDPVARAELRLITCGGPFDPDAGSYRDNVIVYAVALDRPPPDLLR